MECVLLLGIYGRGILSQCVFTLNRFSVRSYFGTTFEVEDLSKISTSGLITAGIDDSAIIYLNEKGIVIYNLSEGQDILYSS